MSLPSFEVFQAQKPENKDLRILAFDPGETIGWAFFQNGLQAVNEIRTTEYTSEQLEDIVRLIDDVKPDVIVYESYRVYSWMTEQHAWNDIHTAQMIGIIRLKALERSLPYMMQSAQQAKQFCTDNKLQAWNFWAPGQRHARDAIRHAVYFALFGDMQKTWSQNGKPKK